MATLSIDSDNVVELMNLKNARTGEDITTATVTMTLTEKKTGAEVSGVSWPIPLAHVASGLYQGNIPDIAVLSSALTYKGLVVADNGADQHHEWCVEYTASC